MAEIRDFAGITWQIEDRPVEYPAALAEMEARVEAIRAGTAGELIRLLEHPPLYTAGTSANARDLIAPGRFPVYDAGRGGQYTYHGPGQRVAYAMLDLRRRGQDLRAYVRVLEEWLIQALARFNVKGERREGRVGIWVDRGHGREDKIGAIGVRVRHWIAFHGVSLNVDCDLSHYAGIVPCGISRHGVTSLLDLGHIVTLAEVDAALMETFETAFSSLETA